MKLVYIHDTKGFCKFKVNSAKKELYFFFGLVYRNSISPLDKSTLQG